MSAARLSVEESVIVGLTAATAVADAAAAIRTALRAVSDERYEPSPLHSRRGAEDHDEREDLTRSAHRRARASDRYGARARAAAGEPSSASTSSSRGSASSRSASGGRSRNSDAKDSSTSAGVTAEHELVWFVTEAGEQYALAHGPRR